VTRLEAFWANFARRQHVSGETLVLENPHLPMLEVNAAYATEDLPHPILISPVGSHPGGYRLEREFVVASMTQPLEHEIWVEQVPWSRANTLATVWCDHNDAPEWTGEVSRELARVLQSERDLVAYLAFEDDRAVGMMIASSDGFGGLWAGTPDASSALFARGVTDFGALAVSAEVSKLERLGGTRVLERYRVWLEDASNGNADVR
jgi:hypothetical protein